MSIDREQYNLHALGITLCKLRRKVADLMFLYELLNGSIDSSELLAIVGFSFINHYTRSNKLFYIPFYYNNHSSGTFFPGFLFLPNKIVNNVDFFFMSGKIFNRNVTCIQLKVV